MTTTLEKTMRRKRPPTPAMPSGPSWALRRAAGLQILQAPALAKFDWLVHGFSTRPGGASELAIRRDGRNATEKVLNLGFTDWDTRERVLANRERFLAALDAQRKRLITLRQIHSDILHVVDQPPRGALRGDALITNVPHLLLGVQTADCIPIFLVDAKRRAVAAVHSGWRGTLKRIAGKAVGRMHLVYGSQPKDMLAVLGPGISRCCYEVGAEVAKEYASQFTQAQDWFNGPFDALATDEGPTPLPWLSMAPPGHEPPPARVKLDLFAANRAILLEAGIAPKNIFSGDLCTACRTDLLFSYRREGLTGRMMAVIGVL
jgi:YfiH family protein